MAHAWGANRNATAETGEPNPAGVSGAASVWWTWTAPLSGDVTIDTYGSGFDTTLGVYTGSSPATLTVVTQSNTGVSDLLTFQAIAGAEYQIQVNGSTGATGGIELRIATRLPNDDFVTAIPLSGSSVTIVGSNETATPESGEPNPAGTSGTTSVWWYWTAPETGPWTIDTLASDFDTTLGVYEGTAVNTLALTAENDDVAGTTSSSLTFTATAGTQYVLQVNGYAGASGKVVLNIGLTSSAPSLGNPLIVGGCGLLGLEGLLPLFAILAYRVYRKACRTDVQDN